MRKGGLNHRLAYQIVFLLQGPLCEVTSDVFVAGE